MTDRKQVSSEIVTFRRFANVCPVAIDVASIEKRDPPEPDIRCRYRDSKKFVAFELVELIDENFARLTSRQLTDAATLQAAYESSGGPIRGALDDRFGNANVHVVFRPETTARERKQSVPTILRELSKVEADYVGIWRPAPGSPLAVAVRWILISRGRYRGPLFDVDANTSIGDPTLTRIRAKWTKTYVTPHPIELLAFYELQPLTPDAWWKPQLESFFGGNWASGQFRRVWLFDVGSETIQYCAERPASR